MIKNMPKGEKSQLMETPAARVEEKEKEKIDRALDQLKILIGQKEDERGRKWKIMPGTRIKEEDYLPENKDELEKKRKNKMRMRNWSGIVLLNVNEINDEFIHDLEIKEDAILLREAYVNVNQLDRIISNDEFLWASVLSAPEVDSNPAIAAQKINEMLNSTVKDFISQLDNLTKGQPDLKKRFAGLLSLFIDRLERIEDEDKKDLQSNIFNKLAEVEPDKIEQLKREIERLYREMWVDEESEKTKAEKEQQAVLAAVKIALIKRTDALLSKTMSELNSIKENKKAA